MFTSFIHFSFIHPFIHPLPFIHLGGFVPVGLRLYLHCFVLLAPSSGNGVNVGPYLFWGDDNSSAWLLPQSSNIRHKLPP